MLDLPRSRGPSRYVIEDPRVAAIVDEILREAGLALAVVHGSRAKGTARPTSDLDVAVLAVDARPLPWSRLGLLAEDLSRALAQEVDVSDLSTPDAVFRFEVARCARLLYQAGLDSFPDFLAKAMIDHADIERFLPELVAGVAPRARPPTCRRRVEGMSGEVLARKIAAIRARTARVRELLPETVEEFTARRTETEALILNLFLALQQSSDLALHVVADLGLGVPGEPRAAFEALAQAGVIPADLARRLSAAVGLRNRIAHEYGRLDLAKVHGAARDDLVDLDAWADAAARARLET